MEEESEDLQGEAGLAVEGEGGQVRGVWEGLVGEMMVKEQRCWERKQGGSGKTSGME